MYFLNLESYTILQTLGRSILLMAAAMVTHLAPRAFSPTSLRRHEPRGQPSIPVTEVNPGNIWSARVEIDTAHELTFSFWNG